MIDSRAFYNCFKQYVEFDWVKINSYSETQLYSRPPYFSFRLAKKYVSKYKDIEIVINNFNGQLKWVLIKRKRNDETYNYCIIPAFFAANKQSKNTPLDTLQQKTDLAILDMPKLISDLEKTLVVKPRH
ncbi:MAG: hypothetical protein ACI9CO_002478 [Candidatus Azotimanducaceae bacterium]|jgi:hypothetical protein